MCWSEDRGGGLSELGSRRGHQSSGDIAAGGRVGAPWRLPAPPAQDWPLALPSAHQVKCYHKKYRSATRDVIFRLQFHMGAVQGYGLVFGKEDLDNASQGEARQRLGRAGGWQRVLVALWPRSPHAPRGNLLTAREGPHGTRSRGPENIPEEHAGTSAPLGFGCRLGWGGSAPLAPAFLPHLSDLVHDLPFSDDRFPDNGKIELLFSATPEKIQGRRGAGPRGRRSYGVSVQSPTSVHSGRLPSQLFQEQAVFQRVWGGL